MRSTDKRQVAILAEHCYQAGVEEIVISPGSRNAPLIIAFQAHPKIQCYLIHDERTAAFFALGLAQAKNKPVALTCTSGSALLNYAPAVAEAYYRQIPLLVLSADRPVELIDQGDGQTMRQSNVYSNYIKKSVDLANHDQDNQVEQSVKQIQKGLSELVNEPKGPVHINIPLAEPLYNEVEIEPIQRLEITESPKHELGSSEIKSITNAWQTAKKKLIIIGQTFPDPGFEQLIIKLSEDPSVAILVENTSNVQHFPKIVHSIDRTLANIREEEVADFQPDLLLSLGGAIISKRIKSLLRKGTPIHNWRVGEFLIQEDTYQSLTCAFPVKTSIFLDILLKSPVTNLSNYGGKWKQKDFLAQDIHQSYLSQLYYSDLKVFEFILDALPESINLHMGNSSVVRYCQLFNPVKSFSYFSNRGLSGIDGSTSTAAGHSLLDSDKLNLLISGDTSFFYDSNALWNPYLKGNFKIIVIRNGGGGIFQIIDGPTKSERSETFFAPFEASVKGICDAFDVNYLYADKLESIENIFYQFMERSENDRPTVLEIDTKDCKNGEALKGYFEAIAEHG